MRKTDVRSLCEKAIAAKIPTVAEHESKQILQAYGITVPSGRLATSVDAALEIADDVGYPVVAKAVAAGLLHKTEQQAVHLNLNNPQAIRINESSMSVFVRTWVRPATTIDGSWPSNATPKRRKLPWPRTRPPS